VSHLFDWLQGDGQAEVVAAWAGGRLEARRAGEQAVMITDARAATLYNLSAANGELVYRDAIASPVAALVVADYRGDGHPLLLVCGLLPLPCAELPYTLIMCAFVGGDDGRRGAWLRQIGSRHTSCPASSGRKRRQ
jgi:hypothetical protein